MSQLEIESTTETLSQPQKRINESFIKILKGDVFQGLELSIRHKNELYIISFCNYIVKHLDVYKKLRDVAIGILNDTHISSDNCNVLAINLICKYFHPHLSDIHKAFRKFTQILHNKNSTLLNENLTIPGDCVLDLFENNTIHQLDSFIEQIARFKLQVQTHEQSVYINKCEEIDNTRRTRRLDSLAKLLNLSSDYSVCSAVSIVNNQLIIACNINKYIDPHEVTENLYRSFLIIQQTLITLLDIDPLPLILLNDIEIDASHLFEEGFIENIEINELQKYFNAEYLSIVLRFLEDLAKAGGLFIKKTILFQAFTKLYASIVSNKNREINEIDELTDDLTNRDISILMDRELSPVILVPQKKEENGNQGILINRKNDTIDFLNFLDKDQVLEIHTFHAEQLIAFYIENRMRESIGVQNKISIGISKPACADCSEVLKQNFLFRATSNVSFLNTAQLFDHHRPIRERNISELGKRLTQSPLPKNTKRISMETAPSTPPQLPHNQEKVKVTYLKSSPFFSPAQIPLNHDNCFRERDKESIRPPLCLDINHRATSMEMFIKNCSITGLSHDLFSSTTSSKSSEPYINENNHASKMAEASPKPDRHT